MATVEERLHRLEAIAEIKELTARYCLHVSRNEGQAVVDLFTYDGVLDGSSAGMGVISGRAALLEFYEESVTTAEESLPFIHNHIIEIDGDRASGTCALEARFSRGGRSITTAGHYQDTYRLEGGRWLFAERKLFFHHVVPLSAGWAESKRAT
jgi:ketosteroid isomerase-like protein